jgi:hypothetical protein
MTIKPVLVPDHDAADLRDLMNRFGTAAQSATPAAQANQIRQQLTEMDYGGGRSPHAGMGIPRDDLADVDAGRKEIIVKPEAAKKTFKRVGDQLDQAFSQAYDDKDVKEGQDIPATVHDINMKMMQLLDKNKQTRDPKEKNELKLEFQKLKTERNRLLNIDSKDTTTGALDEGNVTESVDPVAQLRADILRFAR